MASIDAYKLTDGSKRWRVRIRRDGYPPVLKRGFLRRRDAEEWAIGAEADLRDKLLFGHRRVRLRDAIAAYQMHELPALAATEQRNRVRQLAWWDARRGEELLHELSLPMVREDLRALRRGEASMTGRPVKFATANRYKAALSAVLSMAVEEEWISANPLRQGSRRRTSAKSEREKRRDRELLPGELLIIWRECQASKDRRLYPLAVCAYASGARQGELMKMRWEDVTLRPRVYDPATGESRWGVPQATIPDTKNGEDRVIYFPGVAGDVLREWARTSRHAKYVFPKLRFRGGEVPDFPTMAWKRALQRGKLEDVWFHDLRHSWACNILDSGASLAQLMILGGWKSPAMVRHYAARAQRHGAEAVERLASRGLAG